MADSDSDGEFERFLQEDEASLSPEPMARKSRANGAYTASSASAVTAAAAALLASSKLTQKHKNKSKNKDKILDKNKRLSKTQLSDSEEAPPSYYDDYSTGRGADLDDSDADPYAFDMSSLALASSTKEDKEDADKKKKKKKGFKTLAKKAVAKSAPISMEDRIAEILKRTGSTQIQDDDKSDEDEIGDKGRQHDDEKDSDGSGSDAEHSSLSDSLGVGSADFEVRLPPKPSLDRTRLSLSSLDSEKFVVNRDALNNELATPSRYEQQQMPFSRSEQDEDSTAEKDEYEEDEFELDHTTVEDDKDTFPSYASVQDQAGDKLRDKPEEPLVSQFDKMKPLDASDTFGYGDDDFESPPPPPPPADDDEEDEQELNGFTLDAPRKNGRTPVVTHNAASAVTDVASVARAPLIEPLSISFDAGLLAEDEDTQPEIDEFVRSSQIMRHEKRVAAQRATRDATSHLSQTSYSKLQKEIKSQDNLIAAFQRENERLMQQLKQVRQDVHYDVHEANEELRRQIKKLQDQIGETSTLGGGSDNTSKAKYRVAVEARLEAEAHALALQEELSASKLSYQQKLNEVTLELDRVKKAKVELECRYEGVDLAQVAHETLHARELQNELDLSKKEHARALNALQKKLDWYVENQRLLDDQDEELRRLRRQVNAQPSEPQTGTPSKELEGRLAELEEAMRRRHPDSLANLILASRRADDESKTRALEHDYEEKLAAVSLELEHVHEANEKKLASFRQQQEKLLLQYQRKIKEQEKQLKQLSKVPLSHRPSSKDTTGASTTSDAELTKRQIREQEIELRREKVRVEQLEAESQLADTRPLDSPAAENAKPKQNQEKNELEEQIADLKTQLEDSEPRVLNPDTTSTAAATESIPVTEPVVPQQSEAELAGLRLELIYARETLNKERTTTTEKIVTIEKQMTDHVAKNAQLEAQLAGSQREMQSLQTHALEVERHNRSLEIQARRVPELEEVVLSLRRELELPRTPSMVQYRSLELKVATLEQKHKLREAELKVVLDRALTSTHLEQLSRERAHRAAITAKNAEIASFKHQLEEILDELAQLQQPPSSQPLSVPKNTIERPEQDVAW
uniref:Centrosomal protein of 162 kDa n=1 Tax=Phytophthora ramorum TaxID=164328 RepID=H3HBG0_PHYRM